MVATQSAAHTKSSLISMDELITRYWHVINLSFWFVNLSLMNGKKEWCSTGPFCHKFNLENTVAVTDTCLFFLLPEQWYNSRWHLDPIKSPILLRYTTWLILALASKDQVFHGNIIATFINKCTLFIWSVLIVPAIRELLFHN